MAERSSLEQGRLVTQQLQPRQLSQAPCKAFAALLLKLQPSVAFSGGSPSQVPRRPKKNSVGTFSKPPSVSASTLDPYQALCQQFRSKAASDGMPDAEVLGQQIFPDTWKKHIDSLGHQFTAAMMVAVACAPVATHAASTYSPYAAADRTGFIGSIASVIESAIGFAHTNLESAGITNNYGISICLFTLLIKILSLPLVTLQLKTTTQLTQLGPMGKTIYNAFPEAKDTEQRTKMTQDLYKRAEVDPLAALWPVLVQIPVFISLSRALRNLAAEGQLSEPFLWLPNLAGPRYQEPTSQAFEWLTSILSGTPKLGWEDTLAYLCLPIALLATQKLSQRLLQPPRDLDVMTAEMPMVLQGPTGQQIVLFITDNWPLLIIFFFALGSPAGLTTYYLANNLLTTLISLVARPIIKDDVEKAMSTVIKGLEEELESTLNMTVEELEPTGSAQSWIYLPGSRQPITILSEPSMNSTLTERKLQPGDTFRVSQLQPGVDGELFLKLSDGRGWLLDNAPGVGRQCYTKKQFGKVADSMLKRSAVPVGGAVVVLGTIWRLFGR